MSATNIVLSVAVVGLVALNVVVILRLKEMQDSFDRTENTINETAQIIKAII
jgi:hypothetical protein